MSFTDRNVTRKPPLPLGIGAAMVAPVALFGTAMIADYPGPNSLLSISDGGRSASL